MLLISILSNMHNGVGHHIPYHNSVGLAAKILGWDHLVLYPTEEKNLKDLSQNWLPALSKKGLYVRLGSEVWWLPFKFFLKCYGILIYSQRLSTALKSIRRKSNEIVLFFDDPGVPHIFSLLIILILQKKRKLKIWIMFRTKIDEKKIRISFFQISHYLFKKIYRASISILTDSESLKSQLSRYFVDEMMVMPIPHIINQGVISKSNNYSDALDEKLCWWPGAPRIEKGLVHILNLATKKELYKNNFRLLISESVRIENLKMNLKVTSISNSLVRNEYESLMEKVDIVLLPYDPCHYGERTSGIFVEAVAKGVIPIVTKDTWMANELDKFDLGILTVDWDNPNLGKKVDEILGNLNLKNKITEMSDYYNSTHGEMPYANKMKKILDNER